MDSQRPDFIQISHQDQVALVKVSGEIDLHRSPALHDQLIELCRGKPPLLVIDLEGVDYMDSSGVGTLVHAYRLVKDYGGRMMLASMKSRVRSVFEISRLDRYFQIYDTVEEAISS